MPTVDEEFKSACQDKRLLEKFLQLNEKERAEIERLVDQLNLAGNTTTDSVTDSVDDIFNTIFMHLWQG